MFPLIHDFDVDDYDIPSNGFLPGRHMGMFGAQERAFFRLMIKEADADHLRQFISYLDKKPSGVYQAKIDKYLAKMKVRLFQLTEIKEYLI